MSDIAHSGQMAGATRDYSLTGASGRRAEEIGLAAAEWYHSDVPRKTLKALMQRRDAPAIRDTVIWIGLHVLLGGAAVLLWGSWYSLPFWLAYGVVYGSACDSRWHECGHGTAFRTRWMNDAVYHIASFQIMRNPVNWRWSHARHHSDTLIVGRDPEIAWMHPINLTLKALAFVGFVDTFQSLKVLVRNAMGILSEDEQDYIPSSQRPKAFFWARVHVAIYGLVLGTSIVMFAAGMGWKSVIPILLIGGPRVYGCWHFVMTGLLQHGGLPEDVIDHRLNSRTLYMNPVSRWLYWNMNYHVEHHMFPMVPYYALPALHEEIKNDLPAPNTSILDGYREMMAAVMKQRHDPSYALRKALPATARPYKPFLHTHVPGRNDGGDGRDRQSEA